MKGTKKFLKNDYLEVAYFFNGIDFSNLLRKVK